MPETKPVPLMVTVSALEPAIAVAGLRDVSVGAAGTMVKVTGPQVPPPGAGFVTVMLAVPGEATSAAVYWSAREVEEL